MRRKRLIKIDIFHIILPAVIIVLGVLIAAYSISYLAEPCACPLSSAHVTEYLFVNQGIYFIIIGAALLIGIFVTYLLQKPRLVKALFIATIILVFITAGVCLAVYLGLFNPTIFALTLCPRCGPITIP